MQEYADKYLLFDDITEEELKVFEEVFTKLMKTSLGNTHGTQFLSKNPPHTGTCRRTGENVPQREIHPICIRNPYTVFESTRSFFTNTIQPLGSCRISATNSCRKTFCLSMQSCHHKYEADKKFIPEGNLGGSTFSKTTRPMHST